MTPPTTKGQQCAMSARVVLIRVCRCVHRRAAVETERTARNAMEYEGEIQDPSPTFKSPVWQHFGFPVEEKDVVMEVGQSETRTLELKETRERIKNKRRTESDGERDENENMSESPHETTQWENSLNLKKKAVVVLTKLPESKISGLRPPTPEQFYSEDESLSSSDSDMQWEPEDDSSDSELLAQNSTQKTSPAGSSNNAVPETPIIVSSAFAHCSDEATKSRLNLPEEEVEVDMVVLARKRPMRWQRGKIMEILTKEDGRLKYKVNFEEKGKSLVSGHHIAFDKTPKLEQLYIGARVVVQCQENKFRFRPGVLGELPSRKNRLRFLVFMDDHTPVYVGLPSLRLVCRPYVLQSRQREPPEMQWSTKEKSRIHPQLLNLQCGNTLVFRWKKKM
ncbi:histone-lysine N-methyltransferase SETDB1-B-like isoform X2 [Amphiprion ocellaris]|uniref:histone-lysine N-methyltransferase SETDB1-B-like isoform X2 n=1 Tax=Amphiprion ocellaris TaxID=80972 RepID=UPI0024117397|nr:histone-lysine N-methyltransferase SETDB1-B-like isoform X2 [Amphiprion ocellaris]